MARLTRAHQAAVDAAIAEVDAAAAETLGETAEQLDRANAVAIGRAEAYEEAHRDLMAILGRETDPDAIKLARVRSYVERTLPLRAEGSRVVARGIKAQSEAGA